MENNKWLDYYKGTGENKNWIVTEKEFSAFNQGKFETILSTGNGYIGSRTAHEEEYPNKHVGLYVSSTFDQVAGPEVSELPNAANIWDLNVTLNGSPFNLMVGKLEDYDRNINLKNGLVTREVKWTSEEGDILNAKYERFVSLDDLHLMAQKATYKVSKDSIISVQSGINAQVSNSGAQHFEDTDQTYEDGILEYVLTTIESRIEFVWNKIINVYVNGVKLEKSPKLSSAYGYARRTLMETNEVELKENDILEIEVITRLNTSRDIEYHENEISLNELRLKSKKEIQNIENKRFDDLLENNSNKWNEWWKEMEIKIDTDQDWDIISTRFAQYQIRRFTPIHDWRANIEAKGFAGEEYKGHTFWDTEIFIWPYFLYAKPEVANNLLKHRYFVRNSAYIKGKENKYDGMMWPWETTWHDKGESCPTWGAVDRKEGKRIKVWPAYNQLHIGACITWAICQYDVATKDKEFMNNYGYEVLFDTARFWTNRLEYNSDLDRYEITKVTGPNEYKENIDNNAWTNYMVWFNLSKTLEYIENIRETETYENLNSKIDLVNLEAKIESMVDKIYLPQPNEEGIIPENDTFLKLDQIDTLFYKENPSQLWKDYTFPELNDYQVLKQADIVALMYTLGFLFDPKIIQKNWKYYEDRTFHHSSLSLSMHTITANYADNKELAYEFFHKASAIDLGTNMGSCDNGIHSASIGGMLQAIIVGFGGIKNQNGEFSIEPNLPEKWNNIKFAFYFEGERIEVVLDKENITFTKESEKEIQFKVKGELVTLKDNLTVAL